MNLRYFFIELLAYWQGSVNSTLLIKQFGLSRQQCSAVIKEYQTSAPDNLSYCNKTKAFIPAKEFAFRWISGDVHQYLTWLQTGYLFADAEHKQSDIPCQSLALPTRSVSPLVIRRLAEAIKKNLRLDVDYVSLNNPNREGRVISPHSFVNTGHRWHLRAHCGKSGDYRDFVLSRFRGEPDVLDKSQHTAADDHAWNTLVTLVLQPDLRLSEAKRQVIEQDYQMQNGLLNITTRGCLVNYLLRELQVNTKMLDGTPEAQQLVCVNFAEVKPWLFEG